MKHLPGILIAVALLAACDSGPTAAELSEERVQQAAAAHNRVALLEIVEMAANRTELAAIRAGRPGATPKDGVDYERALADLDDAARNAQAAGISGTRISQASDAGRRQAQVWR